MNAMGKRQSQFKRKDSSFSSPFSSIKPGYRLTLPQRVPPKSSLPGNDNNIISNWLLQAKKFVLDLDLKKNVVFIGITISITILAMISVCALIVLSPEQATNKITLSTIDWSHASAGANVDNVPTAVPTAVLAPGYTDPHVIELVTRAFNQINLYHTRNGGCSPLTPNLLLTQAALNHSKDMAAKNYFAHQGLDGSSPGDRIAATGYKALTWAENISHWPSAPEGMVDQFYNEKPPNDGHRRNILSCQLTQLGLGYYPDPRDPTYIYWTHEFGTPR
jgi:uncharacterized protein YkwD